MENNFKKNYRFALTSSLTISGIVVLLLLLFEWVIFEQPYHYTLLFFFIIFAFCFVYLQYKTDQLLYKRIEEIYQSVSLLDKQNAPRTINTDMKTLLEEVSKVTKATQKRIDNLNDRENYRREFIGNVAHELKTPLFTVQGYISTLLEAKIKDKELIKKYLKRAEYGVERLVHIVEDLDLITKLENTELKLYYTSFDLTQLIGEVYDLLELKAEKNDISLVFDPQVKGKMVKADREKIKQVLLNLVENSIKYGKPRGTTEITIEKLENVSDKLLVRVTDNGPGIEEKHIERLFERFYRVDNHRSREIGGSGLGLAIVKHIIEAHDNLIYVESEVGIGSEFSFTLNKA